MTSIAVADFQNGFLKKHGSHSCVLGQTGSGKTTVLYWEVDGLLSCGETILWLDSGKPGEILPLAIFRPLNIMIPRGCEMDIKISEEWKASGKLKPITIQNFNCLADIWDMLRKDSINVVCYERYITDPVVFTRATGKFFTDLIDRAYNYRLPVPLSVIVDELQNCAPSTGNAISPEHYRLGGWMQKNIELLRSQRVRIVAGLQNWVKTRPGIRAEFNWWLAKRGADFNHEIPTLHQYLPKFMKLKQAECMIISPEKTFAGITLIPQYPAGRDIGEVRSYGKWVTGLEKAVDWGAL